MAVSSATARVQPPAIGMHEGTPPAADLDALAAVLRSGWLTMGPRTLELEAACGERLGVPHAVACASDAAALHLALLAVGAGPGTEVVVPGVGGAVAAAVARRCGAGVVVADVRGDADPTLDPDDALARAHPRAAAIVAVHVAGADPRPGDLAAECSRRGVAFVEHAPSGLGAAPVGDVASAGLLPCGSAGTAAAVLLTRDDAVAAFARTRRSHAMTSGTWSRHTRRSDTYDVEGLGFNHRIDEIRSALALARLSRADAAEARRRALAAAYRQGLEHVPGMVVPPAADGAWTAFPAVLADGVRERRDAVRAALAAAGIETAVPEPVPGAPARAASSAAALLWLPLHGAMDDRDVERVCDALAQELGA